MAGRIFAERSIDLVLVVVVLFAFVFGVFLWEQASDQAKILPATNGCLSSIMDINRFTGIATRVTSDNVTVMSVGAKRQKDITTHYRKWAGTRKNASNREITIGSGFGPVTFAGRKDFCCLIFVFSL